MRGRRHGYGNRDRASLMAKNLQLAVDAEGIATVTIDVPGRSMNPISPAMEAELAQVLEEISGSQAVRGLLITSAKASFIPGYDLAEIERQFERQLTLAQGYIANRHLTLLYRRLETCGKRSEERRVGKECRCWG